MILCFVPYFFLSLFIFPLPSGSFLDALALTGEDMSVYGWMAGWLEAGVRMPMRTYKCSGVEEEEGENGFSSPRQYSLCLFFT